MRKTMPQHYLKKSNTPENLYAIELQRKAIPYYSRRTIYEKKNFYRRLSYNKNT